MNEVYFYTIILLVGVLVGIFVSPKGPRDGNSGYCPHCGRYH